MVHAPGGHVVTSPPFSAVVIPAPEPRPRPAGPVGPPQPATGLARGLYLAAGFLNVGLAYLGVLLPGLPATPFVLTASYCFSKSSPRLERWLHRAPLIGRLVRDWGEHRGIRRPVKVLAVCLVVTVVGLSLAFLAIPAWVKCATGGLAAVGICTIVFAVPTINAARGQRTEDRGQTEASNKP